MLVLVVLLDLVEVDVLLVLVELLDLVEPVLLVLPVVLVVLVDLDEPVVAGFSSFFSCSFATTVRS